jgi:uncharacterized protein YegP (UPF0339 family)
MESVTIPKHIETRDARDYEFLHKKGLEHIEALSRNLWTDYNSHDPGITMLEALCYAITDLGNRIQLPIPDLLTKTKNSKGEITGSFPTAKQILTTKPITETDYRKLFIDVDGVNNVFLQVNTDQWIYKHCLKKDEPSEEDPQGKLSYKKDLSPDYEHLDSFALQGLYDIYFEPDHDIKILEKDNEERKTKIDEITAEIKRLYHANRNICEDLIRVREVNYLDLLVCGDIEIERTANTADVMAEILFGIQDYFSPSVKRYSLEELLEEDLSVESIFNGPVLENGFITDEELENAAIRREIHLSDLVQIISETEGVKSIQKLKMGACNGSEIPDEVRDKTKQKWTICLPEDSVILPRLCIKASVRSTNLFKDVIPMPKEFDTVLNQLNTRISEHQESLSLSYDDIQPGKGQFFDTEYYSTIQNDLPQLYGTGEYGLSPSLPPEHHAKAKQLKSYLLFYDQILATYFGHLRNIGDLLSADVGPESYFFSDVQDVKDFSELVKNFDSYEIDVKRILSDYDKADARKNEFLDHLLARFSENMNDYAFAMMEGFGEDLTRATLWYKSTLLKEYPEISSNRSRSFDYFDEDIDPWNTFDVAGLKHRLARLLGIRDYSRSDLIPNNFEIFEDGGDWKWRVLDKSDQPLFEGHRSFEEESDAEQALWYAVSLAWNPVNYDLHQTTGDKFTFRLLDENKEIAAICKKLFNSEEEALEAVQSISEYMFTRVTDERFFLFEHILFRPDRDDEHADEKFMHICMDSECEQCKPSDPYSLRLTIVFPGWTHRFSNLYFREYAEKLIRREIPAHVLCRICWIGNTIETEDGETSTEDGPMQKLQDLYKKWLTKKMQSPENQQDNEFLKPLIDLINNLDTIYPQGKLYDCDSGDAATESSIVLGKSTIGVIKQEDNGDE